MNKEIIRKVKTLAEEISYLIVASADRDGLPHIATISDFELASENRVVLNEWFCNTTVANLLENPHLVILIWDEVNDVGYQLLGDVEQIRDISIMNGFVEESISSPVPQVERELVVQIRQVFNFSHTSHNDEPI